MEEQSCEVVGRAPSYGDGRVYCRERRIQVPPFEFVSCASVLVRSLKPVNQFVGFMLERALDAFPRLLAIVVGEAMVVRTL